MAIISGGNVLPGDGLSGPFTFAAAGAPATNFLAGKAKVGSLAINTTTGVLYTCTATNGTSTTTWVSVGSQT
jgi:hypothetical protein